MLLCKCFPFHSYWAVPYEFSISTTHPDFSFGVGSEHKLLPEQQYLKKVFKGNGARGGEGRVGLSYFEAVSSLKLCTQRYPTPSPFLNFKQYLLRMFYFLSILLLKIFNNKIKEMAGPNRALPSIVVTLVHSLSSPALHCCDTGPFPIMWNRNNIPKVKIL